MRIIAQTEVPVNPSFMHLAYTAATDTATTFGPIACILILGLVFHNIIQHKGRKWRNATLLAMVGLCALAYAIAPVRYAYPGELTQSRAHMIHSRIEWLQAAHKPVPTSTEQLLDERDPTEQADDAWGHRFRISRADSAEGAVYRVISAGEDGEFGTPDDITEPQPKRHRSRLLDRRLQRPEAH